MNNQTSQKEGYQALWLFGVLAFWPGIPLHPAVVHFPIALLLSQALLSVLAVRRKSSALATSAYHCLVLGWLGNAIAILVGLFDASRFIATSPQLRENLDLIGWVNAHALLGLAMLSVYGHLALVHRKSPAPMNDSEAQRGYFFWTAIGVLTVFATGFVGAKLVYEYGVGVSR